MSTQPTQPLSSIPAVIASGKLKDQYGNHDPELLEAAELRCLRLMQELRSTDPHDVGEGIKAIITFVTAEAVSMDSPLYMAAFKAGEIKLGDVTHGVYDKYETLLVELEKYIYMYHEEFPLPLGGSDGISGQVCVYIDGICEVLGLQGWESFEPENYFRHTFLSAPWAGYAPARSGGQLATN